MGDDIFIGLSMLPKKMEAGNSLFASILNLAYSDTRANLSGKVCGIFVGGGAGAGVYGFFTGRAEIRFAGGKRY